MFYLLKNIQDFGELPPSIFAMQGIFYKIYSFIN